MKSLKVNLLLIIFLYCMGAIAQSVTVNVHQPTIPILALKKANPILKLEFIKNSSAPCTVRQIQYSCKGTTDLSDIKAVKLFETSSIDFTATTPIETLHPRKSHFKSNTAIHLVEDTTVVWVAVELKDSINILNKIAIDCQSVKTHCGKAQIVHTSSIVPLRTGVAVRQQGQDGVHTSRIPGVETTHNGTLIGVYDARRDYSRDLQGDMDIAINRSLDGGNTWMPMQVVLDMKEWGNLPQKFNGVSDACILVDKNSNDIYIAGLWMHGILDGKTGKWVEGLNANSKDWIHQWSAKGSQPGLGVKETSQFIITKSSDDGKTWSEPVNITQQTKRPEWWLYAPAPGHGITLKDGTLVFPTQGRDKNGLPFSNITWSKDGGKTWVASNAAYDDTTECMAVELEDGSIMLNMRDNRNRGNRTVNGRRICVTTDLGETWTEHPTSRKSLIEPTCMASLHRHHYTENGKRKSILLFCNPYSHDTRNNITLKVSFDEGVTWPQDYHILLDEYSGFGYSCITSVQDDMIGIFYESSQAQMTFQKISLKEILKK